MKQINRIKPTSTTSDRSTTWPRSSSNKIASEIRNTKADVAIIKKNVTKGDAQLRAEAVFAYVTNGAAASNNPLFSTSASKIGATNVYNQLAQGNVAQTLSNLKNYKIELTQERSILADRSGQSGQPHPGGCPESFHSANVYQATLNHALAQVKGNIATFIAQAQAAASAEKYRSSTLRAWPTASSIRRRTRARTSRSAPR